MGTDVYLCQSRPVSTPVLSGPILTPGSGSRPSQVVYPVLSLGAPTLCPVPMDSRGWGWGMCRPWTGSPVPGTRFLSLPPLWSGHLGPDPWESWVSQGWASMGTAVSALCSWYFSGISRTQAQQLLLSPPNAPGAFLVRPSESSHGDYSLSGTRVPLTLGWWLSQGVPAPSPPWAQWYRSLG